MATAENVIRLELDAVKYGLALVNVFTGQEPVMPRSRAIRWELVVLRDGVLDADVGNITDITMEVKAYQSPASAPLISKSTATVNTGLTDAQRQARSDQHAVITFGQGDTGLDMAGADADGFKNFSLVITATRSGKLVSLGTGLLRVLNDGGQYSGNTPTAGDPTYYTKAQIDGIIAGFLKQLNEPGVALILVSRNEQWQRRLGVDDNGTRTDDVSGPPA